MGVIFVAGVHAVGKTTACTETAKICDVPHYSASSLIKREKQNTIPDKGKVVADIDGNQTLLVRGTQRVLEENCGKIILDGHFTLPNREGRIEKIEADIFRLLGLDVVIVYQDKPISIADRLNERDGEIRSSSAIERHQIEEVNHAQYVCEELGIPIFLLTAFDESGLINIVREYF